MRAYLIKICPVLPDFDAKRDGSISLITNKLNQQAMHTSESRYQVLLDEIKMELYAATSEAMCQLTP
ncbi:hypothetical protein [Methylophaga frappieri]|nr:hypothetical protein [Methylophaga frappieri]